MVSNTFARINRKPAFAAATKANLERRTIDRLIGLLRLLVEEFGEPCEEGYCLPFPLTHAQVGSAIGSTRVTVTRLMGKLRQRKLVQIKKDNLICLSGDLTG
ncbi:helix-turn-helix domain-containing protein [Merismopedia glauca]|uniref:helix-turn-helix domain-containing protein n=1 Tax=Merismopedia glauca TaxID=292586 RepID=UPI001C6364F9